MKVDINETKFKCNTCDKYFKKQNNLKVHMRIHTCERPYECKFCGKRFVRYVDNFRHENRHFEKIQITNANSVKDILL